MALWEEMCAAYAYANIIYTSPLLWSAADDQTRLKEISERQGYNIAVQYFGIKLHQPCHLHPSCVQLPYLYLNRALQRHYKSAKISKINLNPIYASPLMFSLLREVGSTCNNTFPHPCTITIVTHFVMVLELWGGRKFICVYLYAWVGVRGWEERRTLCIQSIFIQHICQKKTECAANVLTSSFFQLYSTWHAVTHSDCKCTIIILGGWKSDPLKLK